jgi:hypothetical protein
MNGEERGEWFDRRVAQQSWRLPGYRTAWGRFAAVVLAYGGEHVVPPMPPDMLIDVLRTHGRLWSVPARYVPGSASECHRNAVGLWRSGQAVGLGTGYALSDDALWREHSWAVADDGALIETTEARTAYFGIELRHDDADKFARWIEGGSPPAYRRTFGFSKLPTLALTSLTTLATRRRGAERGGGGR